METDIFSRLFEVIEERKDAPPENSYVAQLMLKGVEKINSKIIEESAEVCEAALEPDKKQILHEICDLMFHTFVLASYRNISIDEIKSEFVIRFGISGLAEKAGRKKNESE